MKFVILSQPRTGSSLLASALRGHPHTSCYDEILNDRHESRMEGLPASGRDRLAMALSVPGVKAAGCKLHASQPEAAATAFWEGESAWDALVEDVEIRVICLYRRNVIAQLASWKIATLTDNWGARDRDQHPTIDIGIEELEWFHRWNQLSYQVRLGRLRNHHVFHVSYEQLCDHWNEAMMQIQKFLELDWNPLRPVMSRGERRTLSKVVRNYYELLQRPWVRRFHEGSDWWSQD